MRNFTSKFVCLTAFGVRYVCSFHKKHRNNTTIRVMFVWKCMPLVLSSADLENINSRSEILSYAQDWSGYRCYN